MEDVVELHIWFIGADKKVTYKLEKLDKIDTCYDVVTDGLDEGWLDFTDINDNRVLINLDDVSQIKYEEEYEEDESEEEN